MYAVPDFIGKSFLYLQATRECIYQARQFVNERLQEARENIPKGFGEPIMGPIATGIP